MTLPVLSLITWSPFVGALLIMFTARHRPLAVRLIAAVTTGVSSLGALWIYVVYDREAAGFQFYEKFPLVPPLGISYELGVDGISLLLVLLTSVIIVGIVALYVSAGASSCSFVDLEGVSFAPAVQRWVFLAFYVGFGVLAGIWPLHTWSPDGHASAPTAVSMLHAGVLMKLGAYGVVRMGMGLLPGGAAELAWLMGTVACVNIVYGALSAMAQTDLKFVVAYSSVSHMGIVMLGAATLTETGLNGSVFQMFAHGVMTGLFFALVGLVYEKAHSREIGKMGGFGAVMPGIATAFTVGSLSSLGLPATAGFIAELLTFLGAWRSDHRWWLFPAVAGTFLTAVYVLRVAKQIFWGPPSPHFQHLEDARGPEWVALVLLVTVLVLFGMVPGLAIAPVDTATLPLLARIVGF